MRRITTTVNIQVNGEQREVSTGTTIAQLLALLQLEPKYLAVERNLELVPRGQHAQTQLAEGDCIEVVTLVGGG